jgi:hypothetical protein
MRVGSDLACIILGTPCIDVWSANVLTDFKMLCDRRLEFVILILNSIPAHILRVTRRHYKTYPLFFLLNISRRLTDTLLGFFSIQSFVVND